MRGNGRKSDLASGVNKVRTGSRMDDRVEYALMILGGVGIFGGIAAICIGWFGASHTPNTFEQTPYVISGGLLGLALVFAGGCFYFSYWLTRMVRESRESREEANQAFRTMNEVAELLAAALRDDGTSTNGEATFVA